MFKVLAVVMMMFISANCSLAHGDCCGDGGHGHGSGQAQGVRHAHSHGHHGAHDCTGSCKGCPNRIPVSVDFINAGPQEFFAWLKYQGINNIILVMDNSSFAHTRRITVSIKNVGRSEVIRGMISALELETQRVGAITILRPRRIAPRNK